MSILPLKLFQTGNPGTYCTLFKLSHHFRVTKERYSEIRLSIKVLDSADRLRDTLIHEMCHQAAWVISGMKNYYSVIQFGSILEPN